MEYRTRVYYVLASVCLTVVVIIIVGAVLGLEDDDNDMETQRGGGSILGSNSTAMPTMFPVGAPVPSPSPPGPGSSPSATPPSSPSDTAPTPILSSNGFPPLMMDATTGLPIAYTYNVSTSTAAVVTAMKALHVGNQVPPDHFLVTNNDPTTGQEQQDPVVLPSDFQVSSYFDVLPHVSRAPGMVMEYVYQREDNDETNLGQPVLYGRVQALPPYGTYSVYAAFCPTTTTMACSPVRALRVTNVDMPQAYMELVALQILGAQFYLSGSAVFNNDDRILFNENELQDVLRGTLLGTAAHYVLENMDLTPTVYMDPTSDTVTVTVVTFTQYGGFYRRTFVIIKGVFNDGEIISVEEENAPGELLVYYLAPLGS